MPRRQKRLRDREANNAALGEYYECLRKRNSGMWQYCQPCSILYAIEYPGSRYCRSRAILARSQLTMPYDKDPGIGKGQLVLDVAIISTLRDFMAIEK